MVTYKQKEKYKIDDLLEIISILRSEDGCPWDKVQTHKSIRNDFLEEVCEAIEAIDLEDEALLREELGDVLLQVAFHCTIENEKKHFTFDDVCDEVCKKLIVRHPHVFADTKADSEDEVLKNWDQIKKETKQQKTYTDTLKSVANTLPALMKAQKVGKRAMRAGFDFETTDDAFSKLESEVGELKEAISLNDSSKIEDELGDVLFSCTNVARKTGVDSELALVNATKKFVARFEAVEKIVNEQGKDMTSLSLEELDEIWNQVKKQSSVK